MSETEARRVLLMHIFSSVPSENGIYWVPSIPGAKVRDDILRKRSVYERHLEDVLLGEYRVELGMGLVLAVSRHTTFAPEHKLTRRKACNRKRKAA